MEIVNYVLIFIFSHEVKNARHFLMSDLNDSLTKKNDKTSIEEWSNKRLKTKKR